MRFKIGNDIILGEDSPYRLLSPVSGLSAPAIRTADGVYAGVDGGYVSSQLYGFRTITLSGFYQGKTCEEADDLRLGLMNKLHIRQNYPIMITTFSGRNYYTEGFIADVKSDITMPIAGEFQITLICPDPIIYDGGDGSSPQSSLLQQAFYKEKPGGFIIPSSMPVQWTSGQVATSIMNIGSVKVYPLIILKGTYTNPKITNITTNENIKMNLTVSGNSELRIDMKKRIITLNGVSVASLRALDSIWWGLERGENRIVLETDKQTDTDFGNIIWRNGFEGI